MGAPASLPADPPPPPPPPGWSPPPPAAVAPPIPRSRRWVTPALAIIVAAVVIVAILLAAGLIFHKASSGTTETYPTFSEAQSVSGPAAGRAVSGSWTVILAAGLRLSEGLTLPVANLSILSNFTAGCEPSLVEGAPTSVTVDATPTSTPAGHAAFWLMGLSNGAGTLMFVTVDLGVPAALYSASGSGCATPAGSLVGFPTTASDSPALVAAVNASGGSAFLAEHPGSAQLFAGVGGISFAGIATSPPVWDVVDTSCPVPLLLNESGVDFNATLTGAPANVLTHSTGPVSCALGLGNVVSGLGLVAEPLTGLAKAI